MSFPEAGVELPSYGDSIWQPGGDPQDPVKSLSDLKQHSPNSRTMIFPHIGHQFSIGGCLSPILADFVDRGTSKGMDTTRCDGAVVVPPFELTD